MTVAVEARTVSYSPTGATTGPFAVPYPFFELRVLLDGDVVDPEDYTIAQDAVGGPGDVTFDVAPSGALVIESTTTVSQEVDFIAVNDVEPEDVERALDRLTMAHQDLTRDLPTYGVEWGDFEGMLVAVGDGGAFEAVDPASAGYLYVDGDGQYSFETPTIAIQKSGTAVGSRPKINFQPGANITMTVTESAENDRIDVLIASAGEAGGATLADGDYGDIVVSSLGTVIEVEDNAITYAKMQNVSTTQRVLARKTAGAGDVEEASISELLNWVGSTQGQVLYRGASGWSVLSPGTDGEFLMTGGAGADPSWGDVDDLTALIGYVPEPAGEIAGESVQTGSYTLVLGDKGLRVRMNVGSGNNLTVPPNADVAFPVGSRIEIVQWGAGQTTVVAGSGVTIRSSGGKLKLTGQYSAAVLDKIATNEWLLCGDLSA